MAAGYDLSHKLAINFALVDHQLAFIVHVTNGAYHCFYAKASHIGNLLTSELHHIAIGTNIFLVVFKIL